MLDDNDAFHDKLRELMSDPEVAPADAQQKIKVLAQVTRDRQEQLKKTVASLQDSLDYLRLSVKYLVFDLEATRRENDYLRKLLSETRGPSGDRADAD